MRLRERQHRLHRQGEQREAEQNRAAPESSHGPIRSRRTIALQWGRAEGGVYVPLSYPQLLVEHEGALATNYHLPLGKLASACGGQQLWHSDVTLIHKGIRMRHVARWLVSSWLAALASACLLLVVPARAGQLAGPDEIRESVVRLEVETDKGYQQGTGFIVNDKRTIVTNNHVIAGAKSIFVTFLAAGKPMAVQARLVTTDPAKDLAILETATDMYGEPVTLAAYDTKPPAKVTAIGYPSAADAVAGRVMPTIMYDPSYTIGSISRVLTDAGALSGAKLIQHSAAINPGNSGGPLFDECGRVIGVNTLRTLPKESDYAQGIFYAVDISEVEKMLAEQALPWTSVDKPCDPNAAASTNPSGITATTKEAEAVVFDRFAACIKARPCDHALCQSRYKNRVSTELASARQADVDLRLAAAGPLCEEQKDAKPSRSSNSAPQASRASSRRLARRKCRM